MTLPSRLVAFISKLVLVLIFLVFMLLGKPYFKHKIQKAFELAVAEAISRLRGVISCQIGRYLTVQLLVSLLTGGALTLLEVDFAVTWVPWPFSQFHSHRRFHRRVDSAHPVGPCAILSQLLDGGSLRHLPFDHPQHHRQPADSENHGR